MFAIEINDKTLEKITTSRNLTDSRLQSLLIYSKAVSRYFYVSGWVSRRGGVPKDTILPLYVLDENFNLDEVKIKTDWDLIVRK